MDEKLLASHAAPLPEGGLAEWYHLLPSGVFQGRDGRGPYILGNPEIGAVVGAFARLGCDLPVDYEHQMLDAKGKAGPVPAAGWIKEIEPRTDGLWGRVEWTATAANCLKSKEYRYISPVFIHDRDGHVMGLTMAALTNTPNLHLQAAASREPSPFLPKLRGTGESFWDAMRQGIAYLEKQKKPAPSAHNQGEGMDLVAEIRSLLGLADDASDEDILGALKELVQEEKEEEADELEAENARKQLGLTAKASTGMIIRTYQSRLKTAGQPDPSQFVPIALFQSVNSQLAALQLAQTNRDAGAVVEAAMSAGKITPAQREWAVSYANQDLRGFKAFVDMSPVIVPQPSMSAVAHTATPTTTTGALDDSQKQVAAAMGIDPAAYLKTLQNEKEAK
jgi:phage I-like protein